MKTPERQSLEQLKAEIEFRAKLARQHVTGEVLLPDYYGKEEHDRILGERVEETHRRMETLRETGVRLSPFLELGAERGQRSLVLVNDFAATGIAADISYHQLRTMEHFAALFDRKRLPVRVCCDANHLPFKSKSFPFVFCYQFLHHFPSLDPIVREIHRVVDDGHFYFDEEPYRRVLRVVLYTQRSKIYSRSTLRKNKCLRFVEGFISTEHSDELEHGVVENDDIAVGEWIAALLAFDSCDTELLSLSNLRSRLGKRLRPWNLPNWLLGGIISGLCRKNGEAGGLLASEQNVHALLACPDCVLPTENGAFDRPSVREVPGGFECTQCAATYPTRDGIIFLMPRAELEALYPWVLKSR